MTDSAFLRNVSLFREFERDELGAVAAHFREATCAAGTVLFAEGAVNRSLVENPVFREAYSLCAR